MFCPTSFFSNQIQIDQFEKKLVGQNMNIHPPPPINVLVTSLWIALYSPKSDFSERLQNSIKGKSLKIFKS